MSYDLKLKLTNEEAIDLRDDLLDVYPVEPPIDPKPPIDPEPPPVQGDLMHMNFDDIWKQNFVPGMYYQSTEFSVTSRDGVTIAIWIPESARKHRTLVTFVETTSTPQAIYGVLSYWRGFEEPMLDDTTNGTSTEMTVPANTPGHYIYANYRPASAADWENIDVPWRLKLQCTSRFN